MRKGILSLLGGGRSMMKTKNMRQAERTAEKPTPKPPVEEPKPEAKTHEKPFVQTINVPKGRTMLKTAKRKPGMSVVRPRGKPAGKK